MEETLQPVKRAAKRYTYVRAALCEAEQQKFEIQILDISASGIQFASRTDIESKNPIKISWTDAKSGLLEPTLLIARKTHQPNQVDFQYYYGSQYYNLDPEVKQHLVALLKALKEQERKENEGQIERVIALYFFDIIQKGSYFLKCVFNGAEKMLYFDSLVKEIKDYERESFTKDDPVSVTIQRLTAYNFHCGLLGKVLPYVTEKKELQEKYFNQLITELGNIAEIEKEVEQILKEIANAGNQASKKIIQKILNESSNRLFYNKQSLLQSVVETFKNTFFSNPELQDHLKKISIEAEKTNAAINFTVPEEQAQYARRTKKPEKYTKVDAVVDVPAFSEKKTNYFLMGGIFLLILGGIGFGIYTVMESQQILKLKDELKLPIEIHSYERVANQIDLTISLDEWKKLSDQKKYETYINIIRFLQNDKIAKSCTLYDIDHISIRTIHEDKPPKPPTVQTVEVRP